MSNPSLGKGPIKDLAERAGILIQPATKPRALDASILFEGLEARLLRDGVDSLSDAELTLLFSLSKVTGRPSPRWHNKQPALGAAGSFERCGASLRKAWSLPDSEIIREVAVHLKVFLACEALGGRNAGEDRLFEFLAKVALLLLRTRRFGRGKKGTERCYTGPADNDASRKEWLVDRLCSYFYGKERGSFAGQWETLTTNLLFHVGFWEGVVVEKPKAKTKRAGANVRSAFRNFDKDERAASLWREEVAKLRKTTEIELARLQNEREALESSIVKKETRARNGGTKSGVRGSSRSAKER